MPFIPRVIRAGVFLCVHTYIYIYTHIPLYVYTCTHIYIGGHAIHSACQQDLVRSGDIIPYLGLFSFIWLSFIGLFQYIRVSFFWVLFSYIWLCFIGFFLLLVSARFLSVQVIFCANTLQNTTTHAAHCNALQHTATHLNTLQRTASYCNILQHTATYCNTLQHTTTHNNTLCQ